MTTIGLIVFLGCLAVVAYFVGYANGWDDCEFGEGGGNDPLDVTYFQGPSL